MDWPTALVWTAGIVCGLPVLLLAGFVIFVAVLQMVEDAFRD